MSTAPGRRPTRSTRDIITTDRRAGRGPDGEGNAGPVASPECGPGGRDASAPGGRDERREQRALALTLLLYAAIFAAKLAVYYASGVVALLAEALHTLSDIFVSGFLLIALRYSRRPPDALHMFGYGRAQNAAALVAATLFISFTSYSLYVEAIPRLVRPAPAAYDAPGLAVAVLVGSMLVAAVPLAGFLRRRPVGAGARAQMMELINDELGLAAALIGTLAAVYGGWPAADPLAAVVVATIIAYNGVRLFRENLDILLGRAPSREYLEVIARAARSVDGVLDVHGIRAEIVGPGTVHAGLHITVPRGTTVEDGQRIAERVRRRIHEGVDAGYCFIQIEAQPVDGSDAPR